MLERCADAQTQAFLLARPALGACALLITPQQPAIPIIEGENNFFYNQLVIVKLPSKRRQV
jgi:hypothetical protein